MTAPITRGLPTLREPLLLATGLVGTCVGLAIWNPGDHGQAICPTKAITGLDCPLCGGLRAAASLGRGNLVAAADHNLLMVAVLPFVTVWWVTWVVAAVNGRPAPRLRISPRAWWAIGVVVVAFTVVRNLRVGGFPHWLASGTD